MSKKALTTAMLLQAILPIAVPKRYLGVPDRDKLELGATWLQRQANAVGASDRR
jgi:hypothetical protein